MHLSILLSCVIRHLTSTSESKSCVHLQLNEGPTADDSKSDLQNDDLSRLFQLEDLNLTPFSIDFSKEVPACAEPDSISRKRVRYVSESCVAYDNVDNDHPTPSQTWKALVNSPLETHDPKSSPATPLFKKWDSPRYNGSGRSLWIPKRARLPRPLTEHIKLPQRSSSPKRHAEVLFNGHRESTIQTFDSPMTLRKKRRMNMEDGQLRRSDSPEAYYLDHKLRSAHFKEDYLKRTF